MYQNHIQANDILLLVKKTNSKLSNHKFISSTQVCWFNPAIPRTQEDEVGASP